MAGGWCSVGPSGVGVLLMAKKRKPSAIPILRNQIRGAIKELDGIEKDLAEVQATLERYVNQPKLDGEEEYLVDIRRVIRKRP
jgi:hypothetical protein